MVMLDNLYTLLNDDGQGSATVLVLYPGYRHKKYNRSLTKRIVVYSSELEGYRKIIKYLVRIVLLWRPTKCKSVYTTLSELLVD